MYDICIVGGGTVGLFLAAQLSKAGKKIVILELAEGTGRNREDVVGSHPQTSGHRGASNAWTTGLGGSSQLWGGQLWPWQDWEFTGPDPRAGSVWPIDGNVLARHYREVLNVLGIAKGHSAIHEMGRPPGRPQLDLGDDFEVRYSTWMGARSRNFALNSAIKKNLRNVSIITGCAVHKLEICDDSLSVIHFSRFNVDESIKARQVVLAAGTLGNSRILSRCPFASGVELVGRGFMDHVSARVLRLDVADWNRFLDMFAYQRYQGVLAAPRIVPRSHYLAAKNVMPAYAHWEVANARGGVVDAVKGFRNARQGSAPYPKMKEIFDATRKDLRPTASAITRAVIRKERPVLKSSTVFLRVDVEQPARPENYVRWRGSDAPDSRELNLEMKWGVGAREKEAIDVLKEDVEKVLGGLNIGGTLESLSEGYEMTDTFHMMGGTPMQTMNRPGVVDHDCRVLGSKNVFVAGASVFPSGGMANPTYTALALAHRLGEQLG